jgi:aminoglycoside phosphotransferase (APT) family kinase protein
MSWPDAEVAIDADLVRDLVRAQFPDLAERPCVEVDEGFDNSLWRLGDDLVARLPRRSVAVSLIEKELRWLPELAGDVSLNTPLPLLAGAPSEQFAWPWLVATWVEGTPGDVVDVATRAHSAFAFATFLREIHRAAPDDAPRNPFRGVALEERATVFHTRLRDNADLVDAASAAQMFDAGVEAARWRGPPLWLHGDLHPGNTLYRDGRLVGVVDFGDLCAGDPACDLAGALLSLPFSALDEFFSVYGTCDEATVARTIGWATLFGVFFVSLGRTERPRYGPVGQLALANAARLREHL